MKLRAKESSAKKKIKNKPFNLIPSLLALMVGFGLFFSIGMRFIDGDAKTFLKGFGLVFAVAVASYLMASQATMKQSGYIKHYRNTYLGQKALQVEFFIKTGLVLLGAEVLFNKVVAIGIPGIFVAWVVTPVVLITTFIFGQKVIKVPSKTLNMVISADMSVCGTSAAIAAAAACKAKKEELTLAIGLSLVFTSIMM
ncbi:Uncharacterised protein family UPF0324, prokaryote like protein, partial [Aduncisulcus paluster]